jgi:PBP1b-binding outer membrane lipoprotein LpoB
MKKVILFFSCAFLFASCISTTTTNPSINWTINGDVTAYNADGTVLRQWDNVVIESGFTDTMIGTYTTTNAIKSFGINFIDPKTHKNIIISNAVPCIIEYSSKEYEEYLPKDMTLTEFFKNGDILSVKQDRRIFLENNFISEIKSDINAAQTEKDITAIKEKINVLSVYHQKMAKKGSYFDILDALQLMNIQLSKKARNLGVKL